MFERVVRMLLSGRVMRPFSFLVGLAAFVVDSPTVRAQAPDATAPTVAVLKLESQYGVIPGLAAVLGDHLTQSVRESRAFAQVIAAREVETVLGMDRTALLANCDSEGCMAEMAGALGVDFVLSGSVGKVGSNFVLSLRLLDVRRGLAASSVSERVPGNSEDALLNSIEPALIKLLDGAALTHPGLAKEPAAPLERASAPPPTPAASPTAPEPASPPAAPAAPTDRVPPSVTPPAPPAATSSAEAADPEPEGGGPGTALRGVGLAGLLLALPIVLTGVVGTLVFATVFSADVVGSGGAALQGNHAVTATAALLAQAGLGIGILASVPAVTGIALSLVFLVLSRVVG
ncbi:MAG: hypothetical protein AB2A00_10700 [Myxococcota bacterium]